MKNDKRLAKGEADERIIAFLEKNKGSIFSIDEITDKTNITNRSTVSTALDRLEEKNKVLCFKDFDEEKKVEVKKYQLIAINEKINKEYLDKLMDKYNEAENENNLLFMKLAINDFADICEFNKIVYEDFVIFLIEHSKKGVYSKPLFLACLCALTYKYKNEIRWNKNIQNLKQEKNLLKLIKKETQFVDNIIYDKNEPLDERLGALLILSEIDITRAVTIAFDLLKKLDYKTSIKRSIKGKKSKKITEFDFFKQDIRKIILRYANVDYGDCRIKILDELTKKIDLEEPVLNEFFDLYEFTKPGFEERQLKSRFRVINPEDAIKYQDIKPKLRELNINLDD